MFITMCLCAVTVIVAVLYRQFFKRFFDIVISFCAIIAFLPLMGAISFISLLVFKGNPFFIQQRPGKREKIFYIIKFRTMTDARDEQGVLLPDGQRLNLYGRFLRSTSLDELPELFNILIGDMSIVGPRPLLVMYLTLYNDEQRLRHNVRPGLTGLAQISGRNSLAWENRFQLDIKYVKSVSFFGDAAIIFKTIFKIIKREGINQDGQATMEKFTGKCIGAAVGDSAQPLSKVTHAAREL